MFKFICLGSGSSGNCYYLNVDGFGVLIDQGLGIRKFKKYFSDYGLSLAEVKAILVTHDHADHVKSVGAVSAMFHWPVYALESVYMGMNRNRFMPKKVPANLSNIVRIEENFQLGPFSITPFYVPHDSAANCGYSIQADGINFCLMTDIGHVRDEMKLHLQAADYVVVESNYDAALLATGPYPAFLKTRISGEKGHLDNVETGKLLAEKLAPTAKHVWLCHLSEENNRPELALSTVCQELKSSGRLHDADTLRVEALQRTRPSKLYTLTPDGCK